MRIALVTDAWTPQTNGVVTTLAATARELSRNGHDARILSPAWLRRFHRSAARTFVSNESLRAELAGHGFGALHLWRRGVDTARFHPRYPPHPELRDLPRPIMVYAGRLAVEKNLRPGVTGVTSRDLAAAIRGALRLERARCAAAAADFTWEAATSQFVAGLEPIPQRARARLAVGVSAIIGSRAGERS